MSLFGPNEVAFVTGAASGIGRATALQFVTDGICQIVLLDISEDGLKESADLIDIRQNEAKVLTVTADVSVADDVERPITEAVRAFGRIDYCVNSAGTGGLFGPITEQKEETLGKTLNVNVKGIWLCERAQIAQMLKQDLRPLNTGLPFETRGSIVNIGSILGHIAMPTLGPYSISKHAVNGITKTDALDYAKEKIRINAVCPGFVKTNFVPPEMWASLDPVIAATPMQRLGSPEEIAFTAVFVASDRASYMTGSMVNVDRGYTAQ
ncbi:hypothetical protein EKO04_011278 [Ascochyta lentis]|uniref:Uncharacterized protein n=1 Tax=Ascochyta lentis TaxID=205686 RepID=A0A8H7MEU1_9PLEO|nr:hypothetical protein EKO04_011278 [Ascochyta lentis]